jgi:hypothetical protein
MDQPYIEYGFMHRKLRHESFHDIPAKLKKKYGEKLSQLIFNSHIELDHVVDVENLISKAVPYQYTDDENLL